MKRTSTLLDSDSALSRLAANATSWALAIALLLAAISGFPYVLRELSRIAGVSR